MSSIAPSILLVVPQEMYLRKTQEVEYVCT